MWRAKRCKVVSKFSCRICDADAVNTLGGETLTERQESYEKSNVRFDLPDTATHGLTAALTSII